MREIVVDGSALTVEDVVAVAYGQARASLGPDVPRRMETSRSVVVRALSGDAPVYGVNTGFGALADTPVGRPTWPRCRSRSCARTRRRAVYL